MMKASLVGNPSLLLATGSTPAASKQTEGFAAALAQVEAGLEQDLSAPEDAADEDAAAPEPDARPEPDPAAAHPPSSPPTASFLAAAQAAAPTVETREPDSPRGPESDPPVLPEVTGSVSREPGVSALPQGAVSVGAEPDVPVAPQAAASVDPQPTAPVGPRTSVSATPRAEVAAELADAVPAVANDAGDRVADRGVDERAAAAVATQSVPREPESRGQRSPRPEREALRPNAEPESNPSIGVTPAVAEAPGTAAEVTHAPAPNATIPAQALTELPPPPTDPPPAVGLERPEVREATGPGPAASAPPQATPIAPPAPAEPTPGPVDIARPAAPPSAAPSPVAAKIIAAADALRPLPHGGASLTIDSPDFGAMHLRIDRDPDDGHYRVRLRLADASTAQALEQERGILITELRRVVDDAGVDLDLGRFDQSPDRSHDEAPPRTGRSRPSRSETPRQARTPARSAPAVSPPRGLVDVIA